MCTYTCYESLLNTGNRKLPRWTPGKQLWTQHWCGIPVCCKYLSVGVGPGNSCWTIHKIATGQKKLHSSRTSANTSIPPVAVCTCMYSYYYSLPNVGEIEICLEVSQLHHMMKRAWPRSNCWTPSGQQAWVKLLLGRKGGGMHIFKFVLELEAFTNIPAAVCMRKTKQHVYVIPVDLHWSSFKIAK